MTPITSDELVADFDAILDRVEAGECFLIVCPDKPALVLIPYEQAIKLMPQLVDVADAKRG